MIILGNHKKDDADYLDACRRKRNIVEYDCVGGATIEDVKVLREFVPIFLDKRSLLKDNLPIGSIARVRT